MRVLLTGATGFVGARVAAELARRGDELRVLARPASRTRALEEAGVEVRRAELLDAAGVREAVAGCDVVLHAAVPAPRHARSAAEHRAVAVEGTRHLLEASRTEGARRFVLVSTAGVADAEAGSRDGGPDAGASRQRDAYHAAKAAGERVVADHARRHGTPAVVARLTAVYGPGDRRWVRLFRGVLSGRVWCVGDGRVPYPLTYLDDAVDGLLRCAAGPAVPGVAYTLAAERAPTAREILEAVAEAGGVELRLRRLPAAPLRAAADAARRLLGPRGREPGFVRSVDFFTRARAVDGGRARRELGFEPAVPLHEGVRWTLLAYRKEGWV